MKLGEILISEGHLTQEGLEEAIDWQVLYGGRLGTNLLELKLVEEAPLAHALGRQLGAEVAWGEIVIDPALTGVIPKHIADRQEIVPWKLEKRRLKILCCQIDVEQFDQLSSKIGRPCVPVVAPEYRIFQLLRAHYQATRQMRALDFGVVPEEGREQRRKKKEKAKGHVVEEAPELMDESAFNDIYQQVVAGRSAAPPAQAQWSPGTGTWPGYALPPGSAPQPQYGQSPPQSPQQQQYAPPPQYAQQQPGYPVPPGYPPPPPGYQYAPAPQQQPPQPATQQQPPQPASPQPASPQPASPQPASPQQPGRPAPSWQPQPARPPSPPMLAPQKAAPAAPQKAAPAVPQKAAPVVPQKAPPPPAPQKAPHVYSRTAVRVTQLPTPQAEPEPLEALPEDAILEELPAEAILDVAAASRAAEAGEAEAALDAELPLQPVAWDDVPLPPARPARDESPLEFKAALKALEGVTDRDSIAHIVLRASRNKAARALLLQVQGGVAIGWDGLGEGLENARTVAIPLSAESAFSLVVKTCSHYMGPLQKTPLNIRFLAMLGKKVPLSSLLFPILHKGRVSHMLYLDNGHRQQAPTDVGEMLILSQRISQTVEALVERKRKAARG